MLSVCWDPSQPSELEQARGPDVLDTLSRPTGLSRDEILLSKNCRMLSTAIHLKAGSQARQRSPAAREGKARHVHAMAWRGSGRNRNY